MSQSGRVLLQRRTRSTIRDLMNGTVLRVIDTMWQDEGFTPTSDPRPSGGERTTLFQAYLDAVDWTDPGQVIRAVRVLNVALSGVVDQAGDASLTERQHRELQELLRVDGFRLSDDWQIEGTPLVALSQASLAGIDRPEVLREHLERIADAVGREDARLVIGSAKELVESTAKLVLAARGQEPSDADDIADVVRKAQLALNVHPSRQGPAGPDGTDAVKKILGASTTISAGLAELRNRGYGTGHGQAAPRTGLGSRHARLAVNAARLWCEFMLDTLNDERAPWRQDGEDGQRSSN